MKTYFEVRDWLENFIPLVYGKEELGLARIENLLKLLGNPEKKFKSVHVAGTAGKGSTSFYIARLLEGQGLKVGLHISPHLVYVGERMQINGRPISVRRLVSLANQIKPAVAAIGVSQPELLPSYFEILVALSFLYFAGEKVDIAVVEVGLGGRLDATNVLTAEISVITNVGLDHTELLGETVEKIALEKSGIIKAKVSKVSNGSRVSKGVPVVTGARGKALKVIEKIAKYKKAPLINIYTQGVKNLRKTDIFRYITKPNDIYRYIPYYIHGECALLALTTVLELKKTRCFPELSKGDSLSTSMIEEAFSVKFPGRFEEIDDGIIVDGAHNPDKIKALIQWIKNEHLTFDKLHLTKKKKVKKSIVNGQWSIVLVVAFKKGKNWQEMVHFLVKQLPIKKIIATEYKSVADTGLGSAVEPEEIAEYLAKVKGLKTKATNNSQEAVFEAVRGISKKQKAKCLVLVTGSLYLVGEVRTLWELPEF